MVTQRRGYNVIAALPGFRIVALCLFAMLAGASGCNDKPDSTPPIPAGNPDATTQPATRPTTQELISGKRRRVQLSSPVLTLEVPDSWKDSTTDNARWIEGDTPHGHVRLQSSSGGQTVQAATVTAMEKTAQKDAAANPKMLTVVPLRPIGGTAKAMERREVLKVNMPRENAPSEEVMMMSWSVEIFVPVDKQFTLELLSFNGLPMSQYVEDREFLEQIVATLHYDAAEGTLR